MQTSSHVTPNRWCSFAARSAVTPACPQELAGDRGGDLRLSDLREWDRSDNLTRAELTETLSMHPVLVGTCCRPGHRGILCSYCAKDYVKIKGICVPCKDFDYGRLIIIFLVYGGLCGFYCACSVVFALLAMRSICDPVCSNSGGLPSQPQTTRRGACRSRSIL
eukprot:SAG11_NODE_8700_length_986_cov_1.146561_1_plen_163_part_01